MHDGIGRAGYQILALVFFGLGVLGLAMVIQAFGPDDFVEWLGVVLPLAGSAALLAVVLTGIHPLGQSRSGTRAARVEPPQTMLEITDEAGAESNPEFDFPDAPIAEVEPEPAQPTPHERALARAQQQVEDTKGWPGRRSPSGMTRGQAKAALQRSAAAATSEPHELAPPVVPRVAAEPPLLLAKAAGRNPKAGPGSTLGKCGGCGLMVLAPKTRPIRLKCPRCERIHRLD